jgi:predicted phage terminase large subunit-like protein
VTDAAASPQELLSELLARKRAKDSSVDYIAYLDLGFVPAAHHRLLIRYLEAVDRGECQRLMVLMPPGSAKSTYASAVFPAWYLGRHPERSVIAASHTEELAQRFGRRVRNLVASEAHRNVFAAGVAADRKSVGEWETEAGGEYYAAGVGGSITGRRADLGIIDDPVRGREDADSERARETAWLWYVHDFLPRLKPGASQIVIMTRWHEDDLGGRLLEREADRWRVVELPMEALPGDLLGRKPGERLWPEWFTAEMVETAKRDPRAWNALYQQRPVVDEGDYFRLDWFASYKRLPPALTIYGASDYAVSEGRGDYTVHLVVGVDPLGNVYIIDLWYGQTSPDVWIDAQCSLILRHRPMCWFGEKGVIEKAVRPYLTQRMNERRAFCRLEWLPSINDKPSRCRPFQALASMGRILLPIESSWKGELIGQLTRFPAGRHDDIVDACSLLGRGVEMMPVPSAAPPSRYPWENRSQHQSEYDPFAHQWNSPQGRDPLRNMWNQGDAQRPTPSSEGAPPYWRDVFQRLGRS